MFEPLRAGVYAIIMTVSAVTIANTAPEPYQNKVVAVYEDSEDTKCFALKDSEQQICYKVEQPKVEEAPPSQPKSTPQPNIGEGVERWREIISRHFPSTEVDLALRVMEKESGGDPSSHNDNPATGDDSYGLFQINLYGRLAESRPSPEELLDPEKNIQFAAQVFQSSGWHPWKNTMRKLGF